MEAEVYVPLQVLLLVAFVVSVHGFFWPIPDETRPFPIDENSGHGIVGFPMLMGFHRLIDKSNDVQISSSSVQPDVLSPRPKYFPGATVVRSEYKDQVSPEPQAKMTDVTAQQSRYEVGVPSQTPIIQQGIPLETSTGPPEATSQGQTDYRKTTSHRPTHHSNKTSHRQTDQSGKTSNRPTDRQVGHSDETSKRPSDRPLESRRSTNRPVISSHRSSEEPDGRSHRPVSLSDEATHKPTEYRYETSHQSTGHKDTTSHRPRNITDTTPHRPTGYIDTTSLRPRNHTDTTSQRPRNHTDTTSQRPAGHTGPTSQRPRNHTDTTSHPATDHWNTASKQSAGHSPETFHPSTDLPDISKQQTDNPHDTSHLPTVQPFKTYNKSTYHLYEASHPPTNPPGITSRPPTDHTGEASNLTSDEQYETSHEAANHFDEMSRRPKEPPDTASYPPTKHPDKTSHPPTKHPDKISHPPTDHPGKVSDQPYKTPRTTSHISVDRPDKNMTHRRTGQADVKLQQPTGQPHKTSHLPTDHGVVPSQGPTGQTNKTSTPPTNYSERMSQRPTVHSVVHLQLPVFQTAQPYYQAMNELRTAPQTTPNPGRATSHMPISRPHEKQQRPENQHSGPQQQPVNITGVKKRQEAAEQPVDNLNENYNHPLNQTDKNSGRSFFPIHFKIRLSTESNETQMSDSSNPDQLGQLPKHTLSMDDEKHPSSSPSSSPDTTMEHPDHLMLEYFDDRSQYSITQREPVPRSLKSKDENPQDTLDNYAASTTWSPQHLKTASDYSPRHRDKLPFVNVKIDVQPLRFFRTANTDSSLEDLKENVNHAVPGKASLKLTVGRLAKRSRISFHQTSRKQSNDSTQYVQRNLMEQSTDLPVESEGPPQYSRIHIPVNNVLSVRIHAPQIKLWHKGPRDQTRKASDQHQETLDDEPLYVTQQTEELRDEPSERLDLATTLFDDSLPPEFRLQHDKTKQLPGLLKFYINGVEHSLPVVWRKHLGMKSVPNFKDLEDKPTRDTRNGATGSVGALPRDPDGWLQLSPQKFAQVKIGVDIQALSAEDSLDEAIDASPYRIKYIVKVNDVALVKREGESSQHPPTTHRVAVSHSEEFPLFLTKNPPEDRQRLNVDEISLDQRTGQWAGESADTSITPSQEHRQKAAAQLSLQDVGNQSLYIHSLHLVEKAEESPSQESELFTQESFQASKEYEYGTKIHLQIQLYVNSADKTSQKPTSQSESGQYAQGSADKAGEESAQNSLGNTDNSGTDIGESAQDSLGNTDKSGTDNIESTEDSLDDTDNSGTDNGESTQDSLGNTDISGTETGESSQDSLGNTDISETDTGESAQDSLGNTDNSGTDNGESTQDSRGNTDNSGTDNGESTQDYLGNTDNSGTDKGESPHDSRGNTDISGTDTGESAQDYLGNTDNSGTDNGESTQDSRGNTDNSGTDNGESTQDYLGNTDNSGTDNGESAQDYLGNTDNSGTDNGESPQDSRGNTDISGTDTGESTQDSLGNTDNSGTDNGESTQDSRGNTDNSGTDNGESTQDSLGNTDNSGTDNGESTQDSRGNTDNSGTDNGKSTQDYLGNTDNSGTDNGESTQDSLGNTDNLGTDNGESTQDSLGFTDNSGTDTVESAQNSLGNTDKLGTDNGESAQDSLGNTDNSGTDNGESTQNSLGNTDNSGTDNGESTQDSLGNADNSGTDNGESTQDSRGNTENSGADTGESTQGSLGNTDKSGTDTGESTQDSLGNTDKSEQDTGDQTKLVEVSIDIQTLDGRRSQYCVDGLNERTRHSPSGEAPVQLIEASQYIAIVTEDGTIQYLLINVYIDGVDGTLENYNPQPEPDPYSAGNINKSGTDTGESTQGNEGKSGTDTGESAQDSQGNEDRSGTDTGESAQDSRGNEDRSGTDTGESAQDSQGNEDRSGTDTDESAQDSLDNTDKSGTDNGESTQDSLGNTDKSETDAGESAQDSKGSSDHSTGHGDENLVVEVIIDIEKIHYCVEDFKRTQYSLSDQELMKTFQHVKKSTLGDTEENLYNGASQQLKTNPQKTPVQSPVFLEIHTTEGNQDFSVDNVPLKLTPAQKTGLSDDTPEPRHEVRINAAEQLSVQGLEMESERALNPTEGVDEPPRKPLESTAVSDESTSESAKQRHGSTKHLLLKVYVEGVALERASDTDDKTSNSQNEPIVTDHPPAQHKSGSYSLVHADNPTEDIMKERAKGPFRLSPMREGERVQHSPPDEKTVPKVEPPQHLIKYSVKLNGRATSKQPDDSSQEVPTNPEELSLHSPDQRNESPQYLRIHTAESYRRFNVSIARVPSQQTSDGALRRSGERKETAVLELSLQGLERQDKQALDFMEKVDRSSDRPVEKLLESTNAQNESPQESKRHQHGVTKHLLLKVFVDGVPQSRLDRVTNAGEKIVGTEQGPILMSHPGAIFEGSSSERSKGTSDHKVESPGIQVTFSVDKLSSSTGTTKEAFPLKRLSEKTKHSVQDEGTMQPKKPLQTSLRLPTERLHGSRKDSPRTTKSLSVAVYLDGSLLTPIHPDELPWHSASNPMDIARSSTLSQQDLRETSSHSFGDQAQRLEQTVKDFDQSWSGLFVEGNVGELSIVPGVPQGTSHVRLIHSRSRPSYWLDDPNDSLERTADESFESSSYTLEHPDENPLSLDFLVRLRLNQVSDSSQKQDDTSQDSLESSTSKQTTISPESSRGSSKWAKAELLESPHQQLNDPFHRSAIGHNKASTHSLLDFHLSNSSDFYTQLRGKSPDFLENTALSNFTLGKLQNSDEENIETINLNFYLHGDAGQQSENPAECAACSAENPDDSAENGADETSQPLSVCSCTCTSIPRHIQVTGENCAWQVVVKSVAGVGDGPYADLSVPNSINSDDVSAQEVTSPLPYANGDISANWGSRNILQVKIEVYSNGVRKACFLFNGRESSAISWMSSDRLICSSYQAPDPENLDLVDVTGEAPFRLSVHETTDGCEGTCGFLSAVEPGTTCPSLAGALTRPYFLYSTQGSSCARWHNDDEYEVGDRFVVSALMCDSDT